MKLRIPQSLIEPMVDWAMSAHPRFRSNGHGRQYGILDQFSDVPVESAEIRASVVDFFGLHDAQREPVFLDYCGFITEGGAIHKHTDPNEGRKIHTRFNVMISKPVSGGDPIQDGELITVEEGDVWRCDAGLKPHWCTPVVGSKPRIVLSYGFLL